MTGRPGDRTAGKASTGLLVYVIILMAFQVFLITVAAEAWFEDDESLAWATAGVSVVLAGAAVAFYRYFRP